MRLRSGRLRHKILIEKPVRTRDASGDFVLTWNDDIFLTSYAEIAPMGSRETFFAAQISPTATHKITMRYRAGVSKDMRVLFGNRVFQIVGMRNIEERSRILELTCVEEPQGETT